MAGNNFSPGRGPATVPATFDRSPTRSFQNVARSFLGLCLELLGWLDVLQEGVEGLRDAIKGTSPLHQGSSTAGAPDVSDHNVRPAAVNV